MSLGIGGNKSGSNTNSNSNTAQNSTGTYTPNNLPFLQAGWNGAGAMLKASDPLTPGMLSTGLNSINSAVSPATTTAAAGANAATQFANGANINNPANQYLTPTASGSYLDSSNPAFQGMVGQISNALQPQIDGSFAADGRYGSGANANAFASALTNQAGQLAYSNYAQERQNQLNAAGQLSQNNATGAQQQLTGAALTPGAVSTLFAPGTTATTASYAPLLAYLQAISTGNGGGTMAQNGNVNTVGNTNTSSWGVNAGVGTGGAFGSIPA